MRLPSTTSTRYLLCFPLSWQSLLAVNPELVQLFHCVHLAKLLRVPLPGDYYCARPLRTSEPCRGYILPVSGSLSSSGCELVHQFDQGESFGPVVEVRAVRYPGEVETFGIVAKVCLPRCNRALALRENVTVWATLTKGAKVFAGAAVDAAALAMYIAGACDDGSGTGHVMVAGENWGFGRVAGAPLMSVL